MKSSVFYKLVWLTTRIVILILNVADVSHVSRTRIGLQDESLLALELIIAPVIIFVWLMIHSKSREGEISLPRFFFTPLWPWSHPIDFSLFLGACLLIVGGAELIALGGPGEDFITGGGRNLVLGISVIFATTAGSILKLRISKPRKT